jgi:putative FmdB family regulatory protein
MPTYQYVCTNPECRHDFELVQSFTDPAASECPVCGQPVRKRFGAVGVVFKGSGFYRTDSRSESTSKKSAGSAKSDGADTSGGGSKPAESKPAAKTDSSAGSSSSSSSGTGSGSGSSGRVAASA